MKTRRRVTYKSDLPSRTQQNRKAECDINLILKRYQQTGMISHLNQSEPRYGDFSNVPDFKTALDICISAQNAFNSLPSNLRKKFGNDPENFVNFINDDNNYEEAQKLGLVPAKQAEETSIVKNDDKTTINQSQTSSAT